MLIGPSPKFHGARDILPRVPVNVTPETARLRFTTSGEPHLGTLVLGEREVNDVVMAELPTGTVTLLFSDVEGSTALLSRLGPAYADALDGQRRVLRSAWSAHEGTELGTEGDSFFVAFPTAGEAVQAAVKAQSELAAFDWPAGEQVRVRMGIHSGSPQVHDGGYVGMDVHRAARIAGAAQGGQVVMSSATAGLLDGCLPAGVVLRDLGSHRLKDLVQHEHLFQLVIDGLQSNFSPLKTLGAASSLPRPATPLVGRDGELAELTALLSSPGVRLLTLTGPGGSGKTRLAVGVANDLTAEFPDGVFFVALANATTPEVIWTTIGEVLDVPPEGRIPPGFFTHVAHRSALFVLDNLEQLPEADVAVSQLLTEAPQLAVIATSRRPLHLAGEHEHAVPTLELPDDSDLGSAARSGAVQMFVQRAQLVRPSFTLTPNNVGDVVEVCRRLDALPLAIELAAARSKLLSPAALVARLDAVLELKDTGIDRPHRQQTLRDTIAWSYDLLDPAQQGFFRNLGVFAGGADLSAISAVAESMLREADPLDLVSDLLDASLVTITDGPDGEPRVGMLQTIRSFARELSAASGELESACRRHGNHYVGVARDLNSMSDGGGDVLLAARRGLELEIDNFREALGWALRPDHPDSPADNVRVGLDLCRELAGLWSGGGYFAEGRRWLELAIARSGDVDSPPLADCLHGLSWLCTVPGLLDRGLETATQSVEMWRRLGDKERLSKALCRLTVQLQGRGDLPNARTTVEESVELAREVDAKPQLANALATLSNLEAVDGDRLRALAQVSEAVDISLELGQEGAFLIYRGIMACTLRELGRLEEAYRMMRDLIPTNLRLPSPEGLMILAEDFGAVLADLAEHQIAAQLLGAADAMRERHSYPRGPTQEVEIQGPFAKARTGLGEAAWQREYQTGRAMAVEDALRKAHSLARQSTEGPSPG